MPKLDLSKVERIVTYWRGGQIVEISLVSYMEAGGGSIFWRTFYPGDDVPDWLLYDPVHAPDWLADDLKQAAELVGVKKF